MTLAKYVRTAHNSISFYCAEVWNMLRIQYIQVVYFQKVHRLIAALVCVFLNVKASLSKYVFFKRHDKYFNKHLPSSN